MNTEQTVEQAKEERRPGESRMPMLKRQRIAVIVLAIVALLLIAVLLVTNHLVAIYSFRDVYVKDGVECSDKYYVKKKNGVYALYDRKGNLMSKTEDGYYIASASGNLYSVNAETGEWELYAVIDYDEASGEVLGYDRVMIFPHVSKEQIASLEVFNEHGGYRFYRDANGNMLLAGTENTPTLYDQQLFTSLCTSCGFTITIQKLDLTSDKSNAPRLPDGSIDYAAYGLGAENTPAKYVLTTTDNVTYSVKVGDALLSGGGYYVQLEGRNAVYIVSSTIGDTVLQPVESLVTPAIVSPMDSTTYSMVQNFLLGKVDMNTLLELDKEELDKDDVKIDSIVSFSYIDLPNRTNTMQTTSAYISGGDLDFMNGAYTLNNNRVNEVLTMLFNMQYVSCKKLNFDADDLKEYGLDGEVFWLSFDAPVRGDGNIAGYVGNSVLINPNKTENGTYYVASTMYDMIVEIDQYYLTFLEWEESDWYEQLFLQQNIAYVSDLKLQFRDRETGEMKTFTFTLDNSATHIYYEYEKGKMQMVNLTEGSISRRENGDVIYTDKSGRQHVAKEIRLDGGYYFKIQHATNGAVSYEPFYKYLITVDRNGNKYLETIGKDADGIERRNEYQIAAGGSALRTYKLIYRDSLGNEYDVLGSYLNNKQTYNDSYRFNFWREVPGKDDKGNDAYIWERVSFNNTANGLLLRDKDGKLYQINSMATNNLKISCVEYGGVLDYTYVHTYPTDKGTEKTENVSATENFRKLYTSLLFFSLEGDVNEEEFRQNIAQLTGKEMSVEEYIALGENACDAIFSYKISDKAVLMNLVCTPEDETSKAFEEKWWKENNGVELVVRFYRYSARKSMVTIEVIKEYDENGNPISDPTNAVGRFYVLSGYLDQLLLKSEQLLAEDLVK